MAETPQEQDKSGDRNPDGTFKPGVSGNPNGRPKGYSIMAIIRQRMEETPIGQVKAWKEQFADTIMELAVVHRSEAMLKLVAAYMDGAPTTKIAIDTEDKESMEALTSFFRLVGNTPKPIETLPGNQGNASNSTTVSELANGGASGIDSNLIAGSAESNNGAAKPGGSESV